jgi:rhamnose transport system permease protein
MEKNNFRNYMPGIFKRREFGVFIVVIVVMLAIGLRNPIFFTTSNWNDLLIYVAILIIVAIGQMMTIVTGGIDLSVGSVLALSGMSVGIIMRNNPSIHPLVLILISSLIGLACGTINGLIISKGKVHPLITTLATLTIYRGLVVEVSSNEWVMFSDFTKGVKLIARGNIFFVNNIVFIAIIVAIVFYYFLGYTRKGREIYAIGDNPEAAKFVGIKQDKVLMLVYMLSGTLAGLGGILWISRVVVAQSTSALGFEMLTIAACVIGGASIYGGVGTVVGLLLGSLLLGVIINSLEFIGVVDFWKMAIQGLIILLAVIFDTVLSHRVAEQLRRRRRTFK